MTEPGTHATHRQAARDAWDVFLRSRFNAALTGIDLLDVEIEVLQEQLSSARRQRNARTKACGLPAEVLTSIFMCAQAVWKPSKPRPETSGEGDALYGAGWMAVTRVCSSWRNVALSTPSLWCDIDCLNLHPDSVMDIISRSRALPLSLAINGNASKAELEGWLCGPVNRLIISDCHRPDYFEWVELLYPAMPILETLDISVTFISNAHSSHRRLPAEFLAGSCPPRLRVLSLRGVLCRWDSPLLSPGLTELLLSTAEDDLFVPPGEVISVLSPLVNLRSLALWNVLPPEAGTISLPVPTAYPPFLEQHPAWAASRTTAAVRFARVDNVRAATTIPLLFFPGESKTRPYELFISRAGVSVLYDGPWSRPKWTTKPERWNFFKAPDTFWRHIDTVHAEGSGLISNLPLLPQARLQALYIGRHTASAIGGEDAWIQTFSSATDIQRVSGYYADLVDLICALGVVRDGEPDSESCFALFPRLEVLIFHAVVQPVVHKNVEAERSQPGVMKNNVALLDLLAVREARGKPLKEVMVDKAMAGWDLWSMPALRNATKVSFF